jgi:hypothetical protein
MDYRLDCEVRLTDHYRTTAAVDGEGWKKLPTVPRYRVNAAKVLIALATRLAPTVMAPPSPAQALAR